MDNIALSEITLEDLLPHRSNMLFISEVLEVDRKHSLTICRVEKFWPMMEENGVLSLILVELAAQTAGVCNGWDRVQTKGLASERMGWLVGIKNAEFYTDYLPLGARILCRAENAYSFANLREVYCEQHLDKTLIGKMTLQLFQADEK
jgi:predicted hotdog family 3-hydroxylacyl-ACP dehydratase